MRADKSDAPAGYAQWLAKPAEDGGVIALTGNRGTMTGRVQRVSAATESGAAVYSMLIAGQSAHFQGGCDAETRAPLVQPGDQVRITFL